MTEYAAGEVGKFTEGARIIIRIGGLEVAVLRDGDSYYAIENQCLHAGGPVGEGVVIGRVCAVLDDQKRLIREEFMDDQKQIVCPWHGWAFDLESGAFAGNPAQKLRTFQTTLRDGTVYVTV